MLRLGGGKLPKLRCHLSAHCIAYAGISLSICSAMLGCGATVRDPSSKQFLFVSPCGANPEDMSTTDGLVVLDWTGGTSAIYPREYFEPLDLDAFETADGGTLGRDEGVFRELVRQEIERIFCDWPKANILVVEGDAGNDADTVVHLTQALQPYSGTDIGEGEYDVCDLQDDNSAIIFGGRLLQLGGPLEFEQWVRVFANVCAHEIAHTLGYGHISREERDDVGRSIYVELMLDRHTMAEMHRSQRFVSDQTNCPEVTSARLRDDTALLESCGVDGRHGNAASGMD